MGINMVRPWILLSLFCGVCSASRILVFYPGGSASLLRSFNHLFHELSKRGHKITVVTSFELPGVEEHNINQILLGRINSHVIKNIMNLPILTQIYHFWKISISQCDDILRHPKIKELLNSNQTYDLFIGSPFYFLECSIAVAYHLKLPVINLYSNRMSIHFSFQGKHLFPYSYIPEFNLPFSHNMNLWQRAVNTAFCLSYSLGLSVYYIPQMDAIVKKHFPQLPYIQEMLAEIPVTLMNTHVSIHPAEPLLPGIVPVGGLTIPQNVELPEDLQTWMDASVQGVILISLGSNIRMTMMEPDILNVTLSVFRKLPQRVLMKWEADHLDGKPDNVRLAKWIPQAAVLAHPQCQLFITHGGLHSWMEAVTYSVPLLGVLDSFFDQTHNMLEIQERGHGIHFTGPWTEEKLFKAITEVLHNPKYKDNIQKASRVFRDQPMSPLQTAVYWTEYVMRQKGAWHLKRATSTMSWYQLVLLDIVFVFTLCVLIILFITRTIFRYVKL